MNMRHFYLISLLVTMSIGIFSCEEQTVTPSGMQASDGTYVGVVHLSYGEIDGSAVVERRDPVSGDWVEIAWTQSRNFDDAGVDLPDNQLQPGKIYQYRMRAHNDDGGFSEYTGVEEGNPYAIKQVTEITATRNKDGDECIITWTDSNDVSMQNWWKMEYKIYRAPESSPNDFQEVKNITPDGNKFETYNSTSVNLSINEQDQSFYYKVDVAMWYLGTDANSTGFEGRTGFITSHAAQETIDNGENPTIDYNRTDLGQILNSGSGIPYVDLKTQDQTLYLGVIENANSSGFGDAAIYQYDGSWHITGDPLPEAINQSTSLGAISLATDADHLFLGAADHDSLFIYELDGGNWSENLTINNLGKNGSPSSLDIELYNTELYMAITPHPDYNLKVLKWTGTEWLTVGGNNDGWMTTNEDIFNVSLEQFDGTLYLVYTIMNEQYNHTVYIKHLNGNQWDTDLEWTADNILTVELTKANGSLYFISRSQKPAEYPGGVYQVTSTATVDALIPEQAEWFLDPLAITTDTDGNLIISSIRYEEADMIYPYINVYDGDAWKTISGDFTDGMRPVDLSAVGTDIYYIFGDAGTENASGYPTALNAAKYTK